MRRLAALALAVLVVALAAVSGASAGAPWSLGGSAVAVKEVTTGNPWAFDLSSPNGSTASSINFQPTDGALTFAGIHQLSADYLAKSGCLGGGSPRFSVGIDEDGDGDVDGNVFIYLGTLPNFTDCPTSGVWYSTGNLVQATDKRFDLTQVGGTFYDTYANALSLVGEKRVVYVAAVVDGGWLAAQDFLFDNVTVNEHQLIAHGYRP